MSNLAILGGKPIRSRSFPPHKTIGKEEIIAVNNVLETGKLSNFHGSWTPNFYGGEQVRKFEESWSNQFKVRHSISVNSATSGLIAAVGASGAGPGDEIIVSPYTMSASVVAAVVFNAVPVFADIDPETFCISPKSIMETITDRTKAIIVVDIFGQAAAMEEIMSIASSRDIIVIEDAAQSPFALRNGKYAGTLGHIGIFSLNHHKHITTGEGGIVVTENDALAEKVQLIRNHGESVAKGKIIKDLNNIVGFNFRMGEIEAAIGLCQLEKGPKLIKKRIENVKYLESYLRKLPGLIMPKIDGGNTHSYYFHVIKYDEPLFGIPLELFVKAVQKELPPTKLRENEGALIRKGYIEPIYTLPMFREKIAFGSHQCPFNCPHYPNAIDYKDGLCPITEKINQSIIGHEFMLPSMEKDDLNDVIDAFHKIYENRNALKKLEL